MLDSSSEVVARSPTWVHLRKVGAAGRHPSDLFSGGDEKEEEAPGVEAAGVAAGAPGSGAMASLSGKGEAGVAATRAARWQWAVLAAVALLMLKTIHDSTALLEPATRNTFLFEVFLYYNPLVTVAYMVALWGVNLWAFAHSRVSYPKVFNIDPASHLTQHDLWKIAAWLGVAVLSSAAAFLYCFTHGAPRAAAAQPMLLYAALPLVLALPFDVLYAPSRFFFLTTLGRMLLPLQPISFPDFFVADVLTSMSKVLSDLERATCRMLNGQVASLLWLGPDDVCGGHAMAIPCVLALPYACRFFQCCRQYSDTREKNCLLNALKYATAFPVILFSGIKYRVPLEEWRGFWKPLWIVAAVVNSSYSFYWDIARDWDLTAFSPAACHGRHPLLRANLYYPHKWVYYWAMVTDGVLRASWTYKLSAHLRHNHLTVFFFSALEITRRFQWIFFRVETEWCRMLLKAEQRDSALNLQALAGGGRDEEAEQLLPREQSKDRV
ncbi:Predicted small molecule transporter [Klebsormidium nitens]|uniref:Predicted small molecule transporter n=1 Tax=Klebsormidium nitens TaxID=105231 RepID=A0A1Y1IQ69_KLENI|nr:Predicted small molecule transporter [Klebsormidium nitens]|eukprot:GAQ92844.1 Predicted small molecule transporter [Klebsormidium nitens]